MIEIVEHLERADFLKLLSDLVSEKLKKDGFLAITTPIVSESGPSKTNIHHLYEYTYDDILDVLKNHAGLSLVDYSISNVPCTDGGTMDQGIFLLRN
jgi:hypothetical protein